MAQSIFVQFCLVCQLCSFLARSDLATVSYALIMSGLDYCNELCLGLHLKNIWNLPLGLNAVAADKRQLPGVYVPEITVTLNTDLLLSPNHEVFVLGPRYPSPVYSCPGIKIAGISLPDGPTN